MLDNEEIVNKFFNKPVYENKCFDKIKKIIDNKTSCVFMFSNSIKNINGQLVKFIQTFNIIPQVTKINKPNIMQFEYSPNANTLYM